MSDCKACVGRVCRRIGLPSARALPKLHGCGVPISVELLTPPPNP